MKRRGDKSEALEVTSSLSSPSKHLVQDELAQLVESAQAGDTGAFEQLVQATYVQTYTLAFRLTSNQEDARDVTQEAYLKAFRGLSKFRGESQFSTWMYRVTANCAATQMQRRGRHRHGALPQGDELVDLRTDYNPELRAEAGDLRRRLLVALDTLPPKLRAVVVLRDVYEMSHDDIAGELGISTTAAKVRLHRARHRLRSELFPDLDQVESRAM
jgi:RNA polymerase sigma-70 factor (ECF subfamily)